MSTNSTISILNDDGSISSIYCHYDGYLDGVGAMLKEHYTTTAALYSLFNAVRYKNSYGIRSLGATIDETSFFEDEGNAASLFVEDYEDYEDYLNNGADREYNYMCVDGNWTCSKTYGRTFFQYETSSKCA